MEDNKRKKVSDFMWWLIFVAIVVLGISTYPLFIFGLALLGAIAFYCYNPPLKSADTNGKEEEIYIPTPTEKMRENRPKTNGKEHEEYLAEVDEIVKEKKPNFTAGGEKTDSFYSGISEKPSIDKDGGKNARPS